MIKYQKELQEQVKNSEQREEELKSVVEHQVEKMSRLGDELTDLRTRHEEEVAKLRFDTENKIRVERDLKETSFKELQVQSIEYQKRLRDQLEEKNSRIDELKAKNGSWEDEKQLLQDDLARTQSELVEARAKHEAEVET